MYILVCAIFSFNPMYGDTSAVAKEEVGNDAEKHSNPKSPPVKNGVIPLPNKKDDSSDEYSEQELKNENIPVNHESDEDSNDDSDSS